MADIKLVKISYIWIILVPIMAKALNGISDTIPIKFGNVTIDFNVALPFSWQLFFFSALAFSLAQFLYALFCPEIIKKYKNVGEFKDDGKTVIQLSSYLKGVLLDMNTGQFTKHSFHLDYVSDEKLKVQPELVAQAYIAHLHNMTLKEDDPIPSPQQFERAANTLYNLQPERVKATYEFTAKILDVQKPKLRLFILLIYLTGFIFSLIVLLQNIKSVITTII